MKIKTNNKPKKAQTNMTNNFDGGMSIVQINKSHFCYEHVRNMKFICHVLRP